MVIYKRDVTTLLGQIEALYKRHALGLLNAQAIGGGGLALIPTIIRIISKCKGWHNILTNSSTFVETSATAMFFVGLSQGLQNGWLEEVILLMPIFLMLMLMMLLMMMLLMLLSSQPPDHLLCNYICGVETNNSC